MDEYGPDQVKLMTEVRVDRLYIDHERRGFFKIGMLPVLVGENVQIRIASADSLSNAFSFSRNLDISAAGSHRIELRNIKIATMGSNEVTQLQAAFAHPARGGAWDLTSVSLLNSSNASITLPHAQLQTTGPETGRLAWTSNGVIHQNNLFQTGKPPTP